MTAAAAILGTVWHSAALWLPVLVVTLTYAWWETHRS